MIDQQSLLYNKIKTLADEITADDLADLFNCITEKQVKKGANILEENQICKHIYFIEKGFFRVFMIKDGEEINTDFVFENAFVTNLKSLRMLTPSDIIIQAGENSVVFEFNAEKLLSLYKKASQIESFGRKLLEELLIAQEEHANLFKIFSPAERYQYLLKTKPQIIQKISISQISSYLGIARETLSRIRKGK